MASQNSNSNKSVSDFSVNKENAEHEKWAAFLNQQMQTLIEKEKIPNACIALVTKDGISLLKGYGYADMENKIPVDPQVHLFRTGSVSKIFTWIAILQLYEQGIIDLDTDISSYLDFTPYQSRPALYTHQSITLRHLMTHTPGFEDIMESLFNFNSQATLRDYLLQKKPARVFPPGNVMAYSNYGTALSGYIVEHQCGQSFEEYIANHILLPLQMNSSSFLQPLPSHLQANMVKAYRYVNNEFIEGNFELMPAPAGGLSTTASDMANLMQFFLHKRNNNTNAVLKPQSLDLMLNPAYSHHPLLGGMTLGLMEYEINGIKIVSHGGSTSVFDAGFYLFPELETGIFIAYSGGNIFGHLKVFYAFINEFFPASQTPESEVLEPIKDAPEFKSLAGEYHQSRIIKSGTYKMLNLLMGPLQVHTKGEDEIQMSVFSKTYTFRQVAPGIYKNIEGSSEFVFGPMKYMIATKSPDGRVMLATDGPTAFIKARWYETSAFTIILLGASLLFALGSLLFFGIRFLIRLIKKRKSQTPKHQKTVVLILVLHALSLLGMIVIFAAGSAPHPVHLIPESFFGITTLANTLQEFFPYIIGLFGMAVVAFAFFLWIKSNLSLGFKIYYSLYALSCAGTIWLLWFYNMIAF